MKRLLLMFIVCCFNVIVVEAQPVVGKDKAWQIVQDSVLNGKLEGINVALVKDVLLSNSKIKSFISDEVSPSFDSWFFFIDDNPNANWEHPCRYVFVNVLSGAYKVISKRRPPLGYEMEQLVSVKISSDTNNALFNFNQKGRNGQALGMATTDYAVIISGGMDKERNFERYWNDCAAVYNTLTKVYNYPKDHIYVLMSDGKNPQVDLCLNNGKFVSSPLDLDNDGIDEVDYSATYENIAHVFNELASILTEEDNLFVFTTDHGGQYQGKDAFLCLWGEILSDKKFAEEINKVQAKTINICMEQCNSGGFIDDLQAKNRVIVTACDYDEVSWPAENLLYDEFVYHWVSAVYGQTPDGKIVSADFNGDGYVSMQEAFIYAKNHDKKQETPQYESLPQELGINLALSQFVSLKIKGPTIVCDASDYSVEMLPKGAEVVWSIIREKGACSLLQNSPTQNQCTVQRVVSMILQGELKAEVYFNNQLVRILTKEIYGKNSFKGTYEQKRESVNGVLHPAIPETEIELGKAYSVHQGSQVILKSKYNFEGLKISHSGVTPSFWQYNGIDQVIFTLPVGSGGIPFHVIGQGEGGSCADFDILFFSLANNANIMALKVENVGSSCKVSIENEDNVESSIRSLNSIEEKWCLEVYDVYKGNLVFTIPVNGKSYELDTSKLEMGTYVIRAIVNGNVLSKKIQIKRC